MKNKPSLLDIEAFNRRREQETEQAPSILEENSGTFETKGISELESELVGMIKHQKREIDTISNKLAGVTEQLKVHKTILEKQDREIASLKEEPDRPVNRDEVTRKVRESDLSHNKELIFRNIVTLIEEKGFSYNDVARLFKLEGFLPPSPYDNWDDKVVEKLYAMTK